MEKKKIKLIYDAGALSYYYEKSSSRSGIFFVAYNILRELSKREDIEIVLYADLDRLLAAKKFVKTHPEFQHIKVLGKLTLFSRFLGSISYYRYKFRKIDKKDNLFKMIYRFFAIRIIRLYNEHQFFNKSLQKEIDNFDVYFSPNSAPPKVVSLNEIIKTSIFLLDTIPIVLQEYFHTMQISTTWFYKLFNSLNKTDYYFTNSEYTKSDFLKYSDKLNPDHVITALLGADEKFHPVCDEHKINEIKEKYSIPKDKRLILSLCTLEPRKNLVFAVKNFVKFIQKNNIEDCVFVLGGGHWQLFLKKIEDELSSLGDFKDKIIKTGYIEDEDLPILYSAAESFVYPSLYEGFGMPVLEAMQCGCPVITSNRTSIPEVIADAGIQINPEKDEELISAYEKMYFDESFRHECTRRGLERAKDFSWKKCVDIIVNTIGENL